MMLLCHAVVIVEIKVRFYDGHDRKVDGLTPTQPTLLRP